MIRLRLLIALLVCVALIAVPLRAVQAAPARDIDFIRLMDDLNTMMQKAGYEPGTDRYGSIYLYDVKTRDEVTINPDVRYSASGVSKLLVMYVYIRMRSVQKFVLTEEEATLLAKMILCDDNDAANALIQMFGDGDMATGQIRLYNNTFNFRMHIGSLFDDTPPAAPVDPYHYMLPQSSALLLNTIIRCTKITTVSPGAIDPADCRKMLTLMRAGKASTMIAGGVPSRIGIAHKHGTTPNTYGGAAYITTTGGEYILTVFLHGNDKLDPAEASRTMAEISRRVYNTYNPDAPLNAIRVPTPQKAACSVPANVVADLMK